MDVQEYAPYDQAEGHISEKEATSLYAEKRREHPKALVVLSDLDCGHWKVTVHQSDAEKRKYYMEYLRAAVESLWGRTIGVRR